MKKVTLLLLLLNVSHAFAQYKYPPSKTVDSAETYFGTTYKDPYRWLEHMKDTATISWFKRQADYTNSVIDRISGKDELIKAWQTLDRLQSAFFYNMVYENGKVFYQKRNPGESVSKLYYREGLYGKESLLFDPSVYIKGKNLSIQSFSPSHDARFIAIAYAADGEEISTIRIMNIATRQFYKEELYPATGIEGWTFDSKAVMYLALKSADHSDPQGTLNSKTKLHYIGTNTKADADIFSNASYPDLKIAPNVDPYVQLSKDDRTHIYAGESATQAEYQMYYAPIGHFPSGKIPWQTFCTPKDKLVRGMEFHAGKVYAITYGNAKNYKLIATDTEQPDWTHAKTIVAEKSDQTLETITHSKNYLLLTYSDGINFHLYKYGFASHIISEIKLPYAGTVAVLCPDQTSDKCTLFLMSWNKAVTEFDLDVANDTFRPGSFNKPRVLPGGLADLEAKEVEVKGHDGTMIPLSIIYKKGIKLDGNNVCLITGYGAYGNSSSPNFNPLPNMLATKGVVIAVAHVRGGSEKGEAWYKGGFKATKPNTWKDLNSCAEYLIAQGYTQRSKLAATGASAGGIMISRAITERPDLYAAAICDVGVANTMRSEFSSNGAYNVQEFGTVKDSVEIRSLYEMDGVAHVIPGVKYPAVICIAGWNDPRVVAWELGKFAAALQNSSTSGKPVLMKVNYNNGHSTGDRNVTYANYAAMYAFILWQCGHPDFQLRSTN